MKSLKFLALALGTLMLSAMVVPVAHADDANQMTKVTVNVPFRVPGHEILVPGTYWFRTLDNTGSASNIVEIYNADRTQLLDRALTRPTVRLEPVKQTEFSFATGSGQAPILVRWFYPGSDTGHAFIYAPGTERKIHQENIENVLLTPAAG